MNKPVCYLLGDSRDREKAVGMFDNAANILRSKGWVVLNHTTLPEGLPIKDEMSIRLNMLRCAQAMVMLPDWERDENARTERYAALNRTNSPLFIRLEDAAEIYVDGQKPETVVDFLEICLFDMAEREVPEDE